MRIGLWKVILSGFILVIVANYFGFMSSLRRERDLKRIVDIGNLQAGLNRYKNEYGEYPTSSNDGKIVACRGPNTNFQKDENGQAMYKNNAKKPLLVNLSPCEWGRSRLGDVMDDNYPSYLDLIPADPLSDKNIKYIYKSNNDGFQLLGYLELKGEHFDYSKNVEKLDIKCGVKLCNFGRFVNMAID